MKILITGGCGFIGSHLIDFHLERGDTVHIVDDLSTGSLNNIKLFTPNPSFHFYQEDLLTWKGLAEAVQSVDQIYHMAAVVGVYRVLADPLKVMKINVMACDRLLRFASESSTQPHVIIASSSSVYGSSNRTILSENDDLIVPPADHPIRLYSISKITDEALAAAYHHQYNLPVTIIRFFNVIGPRQTGTYGMVVPRFIKQACTNEPITVFGHGNQTRSFCDIRDVITALDLIMQHSKGNCDIINIGNDKEISINFLAELIFKKAHSSSIIKHITYHEAYGREYFDTANRRPDIKKLYQLTGFIPRWTIEQTIDNLITLYNNTKDQG